MNEDQPKEKFGGFVPPVSNYCKLPIAFIEAFPLFSSLAELMVVLYILRHTWGYQEFDEGKRITLDEFMNGRKRRNGTRIDDGTGLTKSAVLSGLSKAIDDGFIAVEVNAFDKARVQKFYQLNMREGYESHTSEVGQSDSSGATSIPRTKKETNRKKNKKNKTEGASATPPINIEVESGITAKHPAIQVLREFNNRYPNKKLFADIASVVDESPEAIEKWTAHIKDWISRGWNPTNIKGLLETFEKGIEPRQQNGQGKQRQLTPPTEADYEAAAALNEEYEQPKRQPAPLSTQQHVFENGLTATEAWHIAVEELSHQLSPDVHHRALGLSRFVEYADGYVIQVGTASVKEVLEKRLHTKVSSALERATGEAVEISYVVAGD